MCCLSKWCSHTQIRQLLTLVIHLLNHLFINSCIVFTDPKLLVCCSAYVIWSLYCHFLIFYLYCINVIVPLSFLFILLVFIHIDILCFAFLFHFPHNLGFLVFGVTVKCLFCYIVFLCGLPLLCLPMSFLNSVFKSAISIKLLLFLFLSLLLLQLHW